MTMNQWFQQLLFSMNFVLSEVWKDCHCRTISSQILGKQATFIGKNLMNVLVKQQYELINEAVLTGNKCGRCVQN